MFNLDLSLGRHVAVLCLTILLASAPGQCEIVGSESVRTCEPISFTTCKDLGSNSYNVTGMPNLVDHHDQVCISLLSVFWVTFSEIPIPISQTPDIPPLYSGLLYFLNFPFPSHKNIFSVFWFIFSIHCFQRHYNIIYHSRGRFNPTILMSI